MDELIKALIKYNEEHYYKQDVIEVDGSDFLQNFGMITRAVSDIVDSLITKSYISKEQAKFIKESQMRCIGELGEMQERINEYE